MSETLDTRHSVPEAPPWLQHKSQDLQQDSLPAWERLPLEFAGSAIHSGVEQPYNGLAQLANHLIGRDLLPESHLLDQKATAFGSADWHAQTLGSAAGVAGLFYALHKGAGKAFGGASEALSGTGEAEELSLLSSQEPLAGTMVNAFAKGSFTGAGYGVFLQPNSNPHADFWADRFRNGAVSALTFGTLNATGAGLSRLSTSAGFAGTAVSSIFAKDAVQGLAAGLPAGLVNSEANSLLYGRGPASAKDVVQDMYGFAITGGALGALSQFETNRHQTESIKNYEAAVEAEADKPGSTLLLDGGAVRGWGHIGLLKYLEEAKVKVKDIYGVSIGALVATLYANGKSADQIRDIFHEEFNNDFVLNTLPRTGHWRELIRFKDLEPLMRYLCDKYDLKPQPNLHIITYGLKQKDSISFEGLNYDLPKAMAASAAIPGPFRWVKYNSDYLGMPGQSRRMMLIDGGVREINSEDLPPGQVIISRLLSDTDPGLFNLILGDRIGNKLEAWANRFFKRNIGQGKNENAIVVNVGKPDILSLGFHLPDETLFSMVDYGHQMARAGLALPVEEGKVPTWKEIAPPIRRNGLFWHR